MTKAQFSERQQHFTLLFDQKSTLSNKISIVRIVVFLTFLAFGYWLFSMNEYVLLGALALLFPLVFGLLIKRHNAIKFDRDQQRFLSEINKQEIDRIEGRLHDFDEGSKYGDEHHPYSTDLDIFGRNSLFQLVSRAATPSGQDTVAHWLLNSAENNLIRKRQTAIQELAQDVEWRQQFQALGMHDFDSKQDYSKLNSWLNELSTDKHEGIMRLASFILPLVVIVLVILYFSLGISVYFVIGMLAINGMIVKRYLEKVKVITDDTNKNVGLLKSYGRLIAHIEHSEFQSEFLINCQQDFHTKDYSASAAINNLQRLLDFLNSRANMFYALLNVVFLVDIHMVQAANHWKKKNAEHATKWFAAIGDIEAISSLASFAGANPSYAYPNMFDEYNYSAKNLGHPLIFAEERVTNHFTIQGKGHVAVITGSNMSGKSTFLRTLGINAVLAFTGAPCCATEISISNFQLFTGMRTQDNLEEHVSSFYAELKRIRQLLDVVERKQEPVFFLLDEILKGTNSKDRHLGSASLVTQLANENAFGLVSTHDLELGALSENIERVVNYSFNSEIAGDKISFDYKLTNGICKSFNASKLMENMGIKLKQP